jgi:RNA polymerase-binding transcription factor DksA
MHAKLKIKPPRKVGKTSTIEVLGLPSGGKVHRKWAEYHRKLTQLREQFLKGKSAQTETARQTLSPSTGHIADAATDSYDRDCALALLSSTQNALYEIDQALTRIVDGTYGKCELSGRPIEAERLKAIPWTRFSAAAQAHLEMRGGGGRVQLGELGTCLKVSDSEAVADDDMDETANSARREAA